MLRKSIHLYPVPLVLALLCGLFSLPIVQAAEVPAGKVVHVRGQVEIIGGGARKAAAPGRPLQKGDVVVTGKDGWIAILLADETLLQLNRNSRLTLKEVGATAGWNIIRRVVEKVGLVIPSGYGLDEGEGWFRNKNRNVNVKIDTPTSTIGVRGTELTVQVAGDGTTTVAVLEGAISAANDLGSLGAQAGEQVVARPGASLNKSILLTPEEAVQWTIPVPPFFDGQGAPVEVREAFRDLKAGEVILARQKMTDFTAAYPRQAKGWSLLALTRIMLGETAAGLQAAEKAVQAAPDSANAFIILSYAHQALFDLDRALGALTRALDLEGGNVMVLVNLARLRFGMGRTEEALETLEKARRLAPENAEVDNLRGFLLLASQRTDEAVVSFHLALELDPSLAEPHMGLGLAHMRRGDIDLALEEITTAVLLDPRRSLFLSYWGKMLYQIERFDKALDVLKTAALLDPRDPTPVFYQSIIFRDLNRPTEAIQALNRAIALNDYRAVYRSRFLLDKDLAVKNVDLSFLYNQLGLGAWAQNKAAAAVKQDYTNASGHLFLGGALTAAGDRSLAMAGEYLLARLFQPANVNTFNTYNEYTSFFEQPAFGGTLSGKAGSQNLRGGDLGAYGALPGLNVAFGAQVSYSDADGWRDTNGERQRNLATLVKWDATPQDNFLGVFSHAINNQRDKFAPRFEFDDPASPRDFTDTRLTRLELGYHRHLSPRSDVLVYLARLDARGELRQLTKSSLVDPTFGPLQIDADVTADFRQPNYQFQGEYLLKVADHQLIMGMTQYRGENILTALNNSNILVVNANVIVPSSIRTANEPDLALESYFISDIWKAGKSLTLEGAAYFDRMQNSSAATGAEWQLNQWSPRLGLIFTPTKRDTLRLAAFRYLSPFIASRIDPMDVAGVPVFRNFREGSRIDEIDTVWEREWTRGFFSADLFYVEKKRENMDSTNFLKADHGRLKGLEAVLNQLVGVGLGLVLKYRYQDISDDVNRPGVRGDREDHLASAGLKFLHRNGLAASLMETYRHERFKTENWEDENIWLTDAAVGYEFPRKRGSVSLEVRNIFDQHFNWVTDQFVFAGRAPVRETLLTVSVNF